MAVVTVATPLAFLLGPTQAQNCGGAEWCDPVVAEEGGRAARAARRDVSSTSTSAGGNVRTRIGFRAANGNGATPGRAPWLNG